MKRKNLNTLVVNDDDLECRYGKENKSIEIKDIKLTSLGFILPDLDKYDLIIYNGRLGQKILRIKL